MKRGKKSISGSYVSKSMCMTRQCECGGLAALYYLRKMLFRCTKESCKKIFVGE